MTFFRRRDWNIVKDSIFWSFSSSFARENAARWSKSAANGKKGKEWREKNEKGRSNWRGSVGKRRKS